jgi:N-acetylglucosaminyldiphosphoundecaprenol N-acetyl-beta-D-mannosaminyltransferase
MDRKIFGFSISRHDAKSIATTVCAARSSGVGLIVTPNLDHVVNLRRNVEFANAYRWAAITVCDGFPVQHYAKLRGVAVKRVTGCEIMNELIAIAGPSQRFFFVVDSGQTATAVKEWGEFRQIAVETSVPPRGFENDLAESEYLFDKIREHHTTILIMGVGAPKSEVWVWRHQHQLPDCWALCLGQAVRTALGLTTRAPKLIRTLHGEWLWRICQEPRRLAGRYIRGSVLFLVAIFEDLTGAKSRNNNTERLIHLYGQIYDAMPSSFVSQLKMVELHNDICVTTKNGQQFWFTSDTSVRVIVKRIVRNICLSPCDLPKIVH